MVMSRPKRPTVQLIEKYIKKFQKDIFYSSADNGLAKLFAAYPSNQHLDDVLLKVSCLNALYSTNIYGIYQIAQHICDLQIDAQLEKSLPHVVNEIADVRIGSKRRYNYSFATKYCSWHRPDAYPIYDGFVGQLIVSYGNLDGFASFTRADLREYTRYKEIVGSLRTFYGLSQFSFKELDKFLWLYGQELTGKSV